MLPSNWPSESDWTRRLAPALESPEFQSLQQFVVDERMRHLIYPASDDVFNAFRWTPFVDTKVVLLGQDPYHGPGQAHGLSFSVVGDCALPPSLKNIFKELAADLQIPPRRSGNLTAWAKQGVLLLNTVMTVRAGLANSHANQGWEKFTDEVVHQLGQQTAHRLVFLLWGKPAAKKARWISSAHVIIQSPHPSPLSAHRGFFGSRCFSRTNDALAAFGKSPIDWRI